MIDLGLFDMKGIATSERLHRLDAPGLPLVLLPIIYQGNMELARTTLELLYRFEDREEFWQQVVGAASRSAYLNVPGPGVDR